MIVVAEPGSGVSGTSAKVITSDMCPFPPVSESVTCGPVTCTPPKSTNAPYSILVVGLVVPLIETRTVPETVPT